MEIKVMICDSCGKEARGENSYSAEEDYGQIIISLYNGSGCLYKSSKYNPIHLCPDCMEKIGFVKKIKEAAEQAEVPVIERIYDIVAEIVADIMEERG